MTWEIRQGDALELLRADAGGLRPVLRDVAALFGACGTTARRDGRAAIPACEHKGRPKPQRDTSGGGPDKGRFATTRGTQATKAHYVIPVRDVCSCGALRVDAQIGLEETPEGYVSHLVATFAEVRRVLRDDGTLWLNLGDSYATRWGSRRDEGRAGMEDGDRGRSGAVPVGLKEKDLVGMPWRVAFALQALGYWLRSEIVWHKPNPMPESTKDRPTKAHEHVFLLAKSERYFYDAAAVEEPSTDRECGNLDTNAYAVVDPKKGRTRANLHKIEARPTRNRRTVWTIATEPFAEAHFAAMPQALVEPCVLAGSRPGDVVLDPFAGSGTVGVVALRHGRRFVGLELNPAYAAMARRRIAGPLFAGQADAKTCVACSGRGWLNIEVNGLFDGTGPCPECRGDEVAL